jgi:hypothetical protein
MRIVAKFSVILFLETHALRLSESTYCLLCIYLSCVGGVERKIETRVGQETKDFDKIELLLYDRLNVEIKLLK